VKKTIILLIILLYSVSILSADALEVRRFGLFIGANNGGEARQTLLYAGDDAKAMAQTMEDVGGISPLDSTLLLDPTAADIRGSLKNLTREIKDVSSLARRTEVMFYYSGHSDEIGIMLGEEQIPYREIREQLDSSGADVVIAVLDSCASGAFTRTKGGQRRSPFLLDDSSAMEGHAFLTSSSETELSQESDRIGASFFTHYLITGLRGAADNTRDGRVTLNEVYQHTYQETLSRTESTIAGPQHPAYEIQLTGTGDLVLTDLTVPTSALLLSGELEGRFSVRDSRDRMIAEFTKPGGDTLKLALPSGEYSIRLSESTDAFDTTGNVNTAQVDLSRNAQLYLTRKDFTSSSLELTRVRGFLRGQDKDEKYVFTVLPGIDYPDLKEDDLVRLQGGLLGAYAPQLSGLQGSWLFNIVEKDSEGVQFSEAYNIARSNFEGLQISGGFNIVQDNLEGLQYASLFNITKNKMNGMQASSLFNTVGESFKGIQLGGVFNSIGRPSAGFQGAGVFNIAGELNGMQIAGVFNQSSYMHGMQLSLLNIAGTMRGVQLGLVNISREAYGLPIGLINLSRNGIVDTGVWYEYSDDNRLYTSFQSGTNYFYTLYYFGNKAGQFFEDSEKMVWGFHVGNRFEFSIFEVDLDGGLKQAYKDISDESYPVPSVRALIALKGLGAFWGITADLQFPKSPDSRLYTGDSVNLFGIEGINAYYRYIFGIRL
jgi:hypothetical protein